MGAGASKQQIGERVKRAKKKLAETEEKEDELYQRILKNTPETLNNMVKSVEKALVSCSPFPETTLLLAFRADPERVKEALTKCTKKVLTAPIQKEQYQWFKQYVFASMVWFKQTENGEYLYQEMMKITDLKQEKITQNMDAVYDHLKSHSKWGEVMNIQNETTTARQDNDTVGLLQESGIRDILEIKDSDDDTEDIDDLKHFIDSNLAVNILMNTAKSINNEFQKEMSTILNRHGEFKPGPMKKVERALSKMENDYMEEEYPKAAKLLDIVRCSASYNTISQLLDGYNAFMDHIKSGMSSMTMARIKNGFLDGDDGGYRDIKVNVVYQSTINPNSKMICEVQFILNQYLYEKKRVHKLYSIAREKTYFDLVVMDEEEALHMQNRKIMKFEPILSVKKDVKINNRSLQWSWTFKSSIDTDLGLLGMRGGDANYTDTFICIDMETKQRILEKPASGRYAHHWITINDQKYLSLQTTPNTINMFTVSDDHQFEEDESMKITLDDDDVINFYEYDQSIEHIFIVKNSSILEKRDLKDLSTVTMNIELENRIGDSVSKLFSLSNDGKYCVIGAGGNAARSGLSSNFFFLISLETQTQFQLNTENLTNTFAPCFVNGDSEFVAVGGLNGEGVEIWSVSEQKMVHHLSDVHSTVTCMYSGNGLLAVGNMSYYLKVYDVTSWGKIYEHRFEDTPRSLFLTEDNKYLVAGGDRDLQGNVLQIK